MRRYRISSHLRARTKTLALLNTQNAMADSDSVLHLLDDGGVETDPLDVLKPVLRFDWDAAASIAWPSDRHPAGRDSWSIKLKSGRAIALDEFHQFNLYAGMLAGIPADTVRFAVDALSESNRLIPQELPTLMLQPMFREFDSPKYYGEPRKRLRALPPIASVAVFSSSTQGSSPDNIYSSIKVIWFQETFGLPTDLHTLDQLRAINWEREAVSWDP